MRGAEFVRRLRADDRLACASVPIIMLTDHHASIPVAEAMRLGVRGFLVKPVSGPALYERLVSVLTAPRLRHAATVAPSLQPQGDSRPVDDRAPDAIVLE